MMPKDFAAVLPFASTRQMLNHLLERLPCAGKGPADGNDGRCSLCYPPSLLDNLTGSSTLPPTLLHSLFLCPRAPPVELSNFILTTRSPQDANAVRDDAGASTPFAFPQWLRHEVSRRLSSWPAASASLDLGAMDETLVELAARVRGDGWEEAGAAALEHVLSSGRYTLLPLASPPPTVEQARALMALCLDPTTRPPPLALVARLIRESAHAEVILEECLCQPLEHGQTMGDPSVRMGPVGLTNLGTTCYQNALLQVLVRLPGFRAGLLNGLQRGTEAEGDDGDGDGDKARHAVRRALSAVFDMLEHSGRVAVSADAFANLVLDPESGEPVARNVQMDAAEFLHWLLDQLDEQLMRDIFGGVAATTVTPRAGSGCEHRRERREDLCVLQVECAASLSEALDRLADPEPLTGDNAVQCDECGHKVDVDKGWRLVSLGDVVIVNVKRFAFDWARMTRRKVNAAFTFQQSAELVPGTQYDLMAVTVHAGSAVSGHYYSFIREGGLDGDWFEYNDSRVTRHGPHLEDAEVVGGDGRTRSAYLLFYVKCELAGKRPAPTAVAPAVHKVNVRDRVTSVALSPEFAPLSKCPVWLFGLQARVPRRGIEELLARARVDNAGAPPAFARLCDSGSKRVRRAAARYLLSLPKLPPLELPKTFKESDELLAFAGMAGRAVEWWPRFNRTDSPVAESVIAATPGLFSWRSPIALVRHCINSRANTKEVVAHLLSPADPCFPLLPPLVAMNDDIAAWRIDHVFIAVLNFFMDPALPPSLLDYLPQLLSTLSTTDERAHRWCTAHAAQLNQICLGMKVVD